MTLIKSALFILTVFNVKYIFTLINKYGDNKADNMKDLINFTEYLRVYSCDMKMSIEEIFCKYSFKNNDTKCLIEEMIKNLNNKKGSDEFIVYINKVMYTPIEFNLSFTAIIDYYGNTYSDILNRKLLLTIEEMNKILNEYLIKHNEIKTLNNKISLLAGCLIAIIMI